MFWEAFSTLDFHYKVLAVAGTLIGITSGMLTIVWHIKTWHRRRLKLLSDYLEDREEDASKRRPQLLKKIANSLYQPPPASEPDISKHVEEAIDLLDQCRVPAAQMRLEELQEWIKEKKSFVQKYGDDLTRHEANVHLFLAAIADRRNNPGAGLDHITEARRLLGNSGDELKLDLLKYEGLLQLKASKWTEAKSAFEKLEAAAKGPEARHYKAVGACGRADALNELGEFDDAIDAYGLALSRMSGAEVQEREPVFNGLVHLKLARLQKQKGDPESLRLAQNNAAEALNAFRSTNGLGVRSEDMRAAAELKAGLDSVIAQATKDELLE
jgi:tetratricopeptide (TPR) repeat protein